MTNEELVYSYQQGDKKALDELAAKNKKIIFSLANKYYTSKTNSIDKEDLEQEGFLGLLVAADKYDFSKENKAQFTTYAVFWIKAKMNRFINSKNTNEETSLNKPVGEDGEGELGDYIDGENYGYENLEEQIYIKELRKKLDEVMKECTTLQEREILKLHYGWDNDKCITLQDIGELFAISGERARQTEGKALRKIRHSKWGRMQYKEYYMDRIKGEKNRRDNYMNWLMNQLDI